MRLAVGALALGLAFGRPASADRVDDYVESQRQNQRIPGLSLAVVRDGEVVKARGYGLANLEHEVPARPETIYQSGSVGKQFTATAVTMLVEQGRVGLDLPVSTYFPETPPAWKEVTVRHLLTHTSGIKNYTAADSGVEIDLRRDYANDELFRLAAAAPLDFPPGARHSYSNTGYVLLGLLIEKLTGQFYGDYLAEHVFRPLGMATARVINEADIVPHRAAGYRLVEGQWKNQEWVAPSLNRTADGALYLTVLDLARWDKALYGESLLTKESLDEMWTPVRLSDGTSHPYGFGWALDGEEGRRRVQHGGGWQGFSAYISRYVDDRLTVIVLTNLAGAKAGEIAHGVAEMYLDGSAVTGERR